MKRDFLLQKNRQQLIKSLDKSESKIFQKLSAPKKIQDFLESLTINFNRRKDTCMSPRVVLREKKDHCMEGAFLAAAAMLFHGHKPLLLDLKSVEHDYDHVVVLFSKNGKWGAIRKTKHAVLRYREPVYRDIKELAMSFFHEYFTNDGKKTMRSFSAPFNLLRFGHEWVTSEKYLWHIADALDETKHYAILNKKEIAGLRRADPIERKAGKLTQWQYLK